MVPERRRIPRPLTPPVHSLPVCLRGPIAIHRINANPLNCERACPRSRARKEEPMKLPSEVRSRINRLAHAAGAAHAERTRCRLLAEFERRLAAGEGIAELVAFLDRGEANLPRIENEDRA